MTRRKVGVVLDHVGRFLASGGYSLLEPPPKRPTFEYRVMCADGKRRPHRLAVDGVERDHGIVTDDRALAERALDVTFRYGFVCGPHSVERRTVGPWKTLR